VNYILRNDDIRKRVIATLTALDLDTLWTVEIAPYKKNRTLEQNALMWKYTDALGKHFGYSKDDMHEETMRLFLTPKSYVGMDGEIREVYSTKNLPVGEMSDFIDHLYQLGAENGVLLPVPEQYHD